MQRIFPLSLLVSLGMSTAYCAFAQVTGPIGTTAHRPVINGVYNVRAFGAIGDGKTLDSPAINRAILAASAAGGGTVLLPSGTYLSLSLRLKSNIRFHLDQGAVLLAAP